MSTFETRGFHDAGYYRESRRVLSGWLWRAVNLEIPLGVAWAVILVAYIIKGDVHAVQEHRLMALHVIVPLSVLLAIEFLFAQTKGLAYITRLSWILPISVTLVTDATSIWIGYRAVRDDHLSFWSLEGLSFILSIGFTLFSLAFLILLFLAHAENAKRYPSDMTSSSSSSKKRSGDNNEYNWFSFENSVIYGALALGLVLTIVIVYMRASWLV